MTVEFMECSVCAVKPGSPTLCPSCLYNRDVAEQLNKANNDAVKTRIALTGAKTAFEHMGDKKGAELMQEALRDG